MTGYSAVIKEASEELSAKQKIMLADTSDCIKLDEAIKEDALIINPVMWAIISIHNEKSDNKDYEVYVIVDEGGNRFTTGSEAFWTTFLNIFNQMKDVTDEEWAIKVYHKDSKNYTGKQFITCSVI